MDSALLPNTPVSEWGRFVAHVETIIMSSNALTAPSGTPAESTAVLTTTVNGVPPIFVGAWGSVDLIRDPYTDAPSGALKLTGLITADVTVSRPAQIEILTELQ